jgi:uncharacterized membrane protein
VITRQPWPRFSRAFLVEGLVCAVGAIMIFYGAQSSSALLLVTGLVVFTLGGVAGVVLMVKAQRDKST